MKIGIDIEDVARFANFDKYTKLNKIYSQYEMDYCKSKANFAQHFAGLWCAKEATKKALCSLMPNNIAYTDSSIIIENADIEILHKTNGCPYVNMTKKIKNFIKLYVKDNKKHKLEISISHTKTLAAAVCAFD